MSFSEFVGSLKTRTTQESYRLGVRKFLSSVYGRAISSDELAGIADQYIQENQPHGDNIVRFIRGCAESPKSVGHHIAAVRMWLEFEDITLSAKETKLIRRVKLPLVAVGEREPLTKPIIADVLTHSDIRMRAAVLVLISSGMRINELMSIRLGDMNLDAVPPSVWIRKTKNGKPRKTFISKEALVALKEYLNVRERYIHTSNRRTTGLGTKKPANDDRVFPFHKVLFQNSFTRLLKKTSHYRYDPAGKRGTITIYSCRAFFITNLGMRIPKHIAEHLAGHSGYLGGVYDKPTDDQLRQLYLRGEPAVSINVSAEEVEKETENIKEEMTALRQTNTILTAKTLSYEKQIAEIRAMVIKISREPIPPTTTEEMIKND